ncbi:type IV pilus secretin PilQ [bacterium]|nr:type IV pilus secretin PilQ [bacterium]
MSAGSKVFIQTIVVGAISVAVCGCATISKTSTSDKSMQQASATTEDHTKGQMASTTFGVTVNQLAFNKSIATPGEIQVLLSDEAAFQLTQTTPTEYVLTIPGASVGQQAATPLLAPKSTVAGIRSARVVQEGANAALRMFVDAGVKLSALATGRGITVKAYPVGGETAATTAMNPGARAQQKPAEAAAPATSDAAAPQAGADTTAASAPSEEAGSEIISADGSKHYTGRLISLDLQDTDIDNALRIIAEVSNLNIIASDDVAGKVTLRLIDVPWDQALDVILKTNGLDQVREGNVIRIAPVDKLRDERKALTEAKRAAEQLEDLDVNYIRVSYARVSDLKEQVESLLSERGTITSDERTNQLIIKDIARAQTDVLELIKRLDLRTPQVLLETQIVEASRNILRDLGFQWNFFNANAPQYGNALGYNFPNSVFVRGDNGGNAFSFPAAIGPNSGTAISAILDSADGSRQIAARLTALETEGKVRVISKPQIATVNNKEAVIKSVETVRVRLPSSGSSVSVGSGSNSGGGATAFEEIPVGIEMSVTPQASPDYYVLLDVRASSSTFGSKSVDNIPTTVNREATSSILVKSGQTFALGGVYRIEDTDRIEGVPFLKDIPFLGYAFRHSFVDKRDDELVFFITPHIVEGSFDPSLM